MYEETSLFSFLQLVVDMTKLYGNAKLVKDFRIDVDDGRCHAVCLDLPPDDGTDMGTSALELALMSYAGCYATIFALTAKKMRIALKELEVKTEAIKSEEVGTITEVSFNILVKANVSEDRIQRIHELTLKGCPVGKIFEKAGIRTDYNLRTEKE
jgi:uncharacterized OsmC-like protein